MAKTKRNYYDGEDIFLFIKRTNKPTTPDATFRVVACLDSVSFSGTRDMKTVNNKCTKGWQDGKIGKGSYTVAMSGQAINEAADVSEARYDELSQMFLSGEEFEWKMANADDSVYRAGIGGLTSYEETAGSDDPFSFSGTISGMGMPVFTKPATT